jgi:hypothetical protein
VVTLNGNGFSLLGVAFYPPVNTKTMVKNTQAELQLGNAPIAPATASVSNPACTGAANGFVACALAVNQQLYGIAFEPRTGASTALVNLPLGSVVGSPSCASVQPSQAVPHPAAVCAIRQNGSLLGFSFQYNPTTNVLSLLGSVSLTAQPFTSDPGCAIIADGAANCAILSGNTLLGVYFNAQTGALSGFQPLGVSPDTGAWVGGPGCSRPVDFRANNQNLTSCAVVSSSSKVFSVTFDPRANRSLGIRGPFEAGLSGSPSCLPLAIDSDQLNCGAIMTSGVAAGMEMAVGLLSPQLIHAATSVLF